jgi:hypothetical protein
MGMVRETGCMVNLPPLVVEVMLKVPGLKWASWVRPGLGQMGVPWACINPEACSALAVLGARLARP